MTRWAVALSAIVILLMGTAVTQADAAGSCDEPLPAPKYEVGDKWTYRGERGEEATDEVVQVEGEIAQVKVTNGDIYFFDKDRIIRKVLRKNGEVVTKQGAGAFVTVGQKVLDFPLQIGKKWEFSYFGSPSSGTHSMMTYYQRYEVVACEEVTTSAGKFSAFKVRVDQSVVGHSMSGTYYFWYAPEVKTMVKTHYVPSRWWSKTWDRELIKYQCK